jgi:hypothetical protein
MWYVLLHDRANRYKSRALSLHAFGTMVNGHFWNFSIIFVLYFIAQTTTFYHDGYSGLKRCRHRPEAFPDTSPAELNPSTHRCISTASLQFAAVVLAIRATELFLTRT